MSNRHQPGSSSARGRVLVVEDDQVCNAALCIGLRNKGYTIVSVEGVAAAKQQLDELGPADFDCVVSDYWMPEHTGLDLLGWIKTKDPALSTIILTGEGEKSVIAESLRLGATDYLEKPVNLPRLINALDKAVQRTARQRHLAQSEAAVEKLGYTQRRMVQSGLVARGQLVFDVCFHPKFEAGGDFFGCFPIAPENHCCLLTDVSGHDLQAAYISAFFHGMFQGMLLRSAPLLEIFRYFNYYLLNEWNRAGNLELQNDLGTSLSVVTVQIDSLQQVAHVVICGAPAPVQVLPDGRAREIGENGGPPLGWFPYMDFHSSTHSIAGGGTIYLWTDGLADLADALGVHPLCVVFAWQQARENKAKFPLLDQANDDILFTAIQLSPASPAVEPFQPLMIESYRGDQAGEIDQLEMGWRRNLNLAIPNLSDAAKHDVLLATREAVLNALNHGCQCQADKTAHCQLSFDHSRRLLRVWVEDPGNGHQFDGLGHHDPAAQDLLDEHRGLVFILNLARTVKRERDGATLILEFQL